MQSRAPIGILLTNLGTPEAPTTRALRSYLHQFLNDRRVIDLPRYVWWPLLYGIILLTRPQASAKLYAGIWSKNGSPLLLLSRGQVKGMERYLLARLKSGHGPMVMKFALGMRYGHPSIAAALRDLQKAGCQRLLILPLYPQYAAATTASTYDAVFAELKKWRALPEVITINDYHDHPIYIEALARSIERTWQRHGEPDRLLFSFHGVPERYIQLGDPYRQQCMRTVELVVRRLKLNPARFLVAFQSRFGKEPWLQPYTDETLKAWGKLKVKKVDVICPGFAVDCLETLEEIRLLNRDFFLGAGGEQYRYIPALNDQPLHLEALADIVWQRLTPWLDAPHNNDYPAA